MKGDGCSPACKVEIGFKCTGVGATINCYTTCGDGIQAGTEICDDGNHLTNDGCSADCKSIEPGWYCA